MESPRKPCSLVNEQLGKGERIQQIHRDEIIHSIPLVNTPKDKRGQTTREYSRAQFECKEIVLRNGQRISMKVKED